MQNLLFIFLLCMPLLCMSQDPTLNGKCLTPLDITTTFSVASSNYLSSERCAFIPGNFANDGSSITLTTSAASCDNSEVSCDGYEVGCAAAAARTKTYYGYYRCDMTASGVPGTVLSCMVESTTRAPYENIYIKLLGNETRRFFTGYFYAGVNYQTGPIALPTSTSTLIAHSYAFEWTSGHIIWYLDDKVVTSEYGNRPIPTNPNTFIINQVIEQAGEVTDDSSLSTQGVDRDYVAANASVAVATFTNFSYTPVQYKACVSTDGYNPGGNDYVPYDPSGCSINPEQIIYTEGFVNGWGVKGSGYVSGGYSAVTRTGYDCYDATPQIRTGNNAIQWTPLPDSALYFIPTTPINSSMFYSFDFWVNGGSRSGQQIVISLILEGGTITQPVNLATIVAAGVQSCIWSHVVVPFASMGVTAGNVLITGIRMTSATVDSASPKVFIDDVRLSQQYAICSNETELVYEDSLSALWKDNSYPEGGSSAPRLGDTTRPFTGTADIKWDLYDQSSGLFLQRTDPWNTNDYQAVSFWMYTALLRGYNWEIGFGSPDSQSTDNLAGVGRQNILVYYGGNLPQGINQWSRIVIPFNQLGINAGTSLNSMRIYLTTSDYQGSMYIDQIQLISNNPPKTTSSQENSSTMTKTSVLSVLLAVLVCLAL